MSHRKHALGLSRPVLAAVVAVAALALGMLAVVALATRPGDLGGAAGAVPAATEQAQAPRPADETAAGAAPAEPPAGLPPPQQQLAFAPNPDGEGPPVPLPPSGIVYNRNPAAAQPRGATARAVAPMLERVMPSRARYRISAAIQEQAPALASCFRQPAVLERANAVNRRRLWSGDAHGVLRLTVSPQAGTLLILDTAVARRGNASSAELACAQRALKNIALDLPEAAPGPSVAMMFPLP